MDEKKLIMLVQKYKELYDQSDPNYHNQLKRQNIWEGMGKDDESCRKKWTQIRDDYRKALKTLQTKSGQAATSSKPVRFEKELEYVKAFLINRLQKSNIENNIADEPNEHDENEEDITKVQSPSSASSLRKRFQKNTNHSSLKEYLTYKKSKLNTGDHLTKYFQSLEETVRTFPKKYQIEAKMKLSALVHEMEFRIVAEDQSEQHSSHSSSDSQIQNNSKYRSLQPAPQFPQYVSPVLSPTDSASTFSLQSDVAQPGSSTNSNSRQF